MYVIGLAVLLASCVKEGPQGPAGPTGTAGIAAVNGKDGANGADGKNGTNGTNGTATCSKCHGKDARLYSAQLQYNESKHATGETYGGENKADCSGCHNNEGFNSRMATNSFQSSTSTGFSNATPVSCYTCHSIHTAFDSTDLKLKGTGPITAIIDSSLTINKGNSNLCINCHQSRVLNVTNITKGQAVAKLKNAVATDTISITSSRFGPHHGPQGNLYAGQGLSGAFEIAGSATYSNGAHGSASCIKCHMADSKTGVQAGGHSMNVSYFASSTATTKTLNTNGCTSCHADATVLTTLIKTSSTELNGLMSQLKTILGQKKWIDTVSVTGYNVNIIATTAKPLKVKAVQAQVIFNYKFLAEDLSTGMHNPAYAKALLKNSIDIAKTW